MQNSGIEILYPYGELFVSQKNSTFDSRYKFTAKELDNETNYTYFGARYYDSDLSSWLSVDPMTSKFYSTSPYMFCIGNPVRLVDYNGMDTIMFNNKGNFGSPIPDNNDCDTYVKVNDKEFSANKIDYNKKGELKNRHANKQFSKEFRLSHFGVNSQNVSGDAYQLNDYSEAKKI
jgi:RHS repeat-associated protein